MTVVNEKYLTLQYNKELNCIVQSWKGFYNSEDFRKGVNRTNQLFAEMKPVYTFLVDGTESAVVRNEDTQWAAETALPLAIKNGLKYYGIVLPKNLFAQVSVKNLRKSLNLPIEVQTFD